jgi:type IV secretory pathway VirB2 component (pilin)
MTRKKYYLEMLLFAIILPMVLILLGVLAMSVLEPVPEFGGYAQEWSRKVRGVISVVLVVIAFKCARIHNHAQGSSRFWLGKVATGDSGVQRLAQSIVLAFLVYSAANIVSALLIYENHYGGGIDFL